MRALIDGDVILYQAGFSSEERIYEVLSPDGEVLSTFNYKKEAKEFHEEFLDGDEDYTINYTSRPQPKKVALGNAKKMIQGILNAVNADEYSVYLTGDGNFRHEIATIQPYKGNRRAGKPHHYEALKTYLIKKHGAEIQPYQEADDAMAIEQMLGWEAFEEEDFYTGEGELRTCICTIDKDLDMVPGWHYNWGKEELYWVSEEDGIKFFYTQLLTGDRVDNIRGVEGVGKARAERALDGLSEPLEMYEKCLELYQGNEGELLENARLLWMRREADEMWVPPHE